MSVTKVIPAETQSKLHKLWHEGLTIGDIADRIGVSRDYCSKLLSSLGMRRAQGWKPEGFTAWGRRPKPRWRPVYHPKLSVEVETANEREQIAAHLEQRGVTKCPTAYVAPTQAAKL